MLKKEGLGERSLSPAPKVTPMLNVNPAYSTFPHRAKAAQKLARWIAHGVERKKTVALAGRYRLWAQDLGTEIRVGFHGQGQPLVVVRREAP